MSYSTNSSFYEQQTIMRQIWIAVWSYWWLQVGSSLSRMLSSLNVRNDNVPDIFLVLLRAEEVQNTARIHLIYTSISRRCSSKLKCLKIFLHLIVWESLRHFVMSCLWYFADIGLFFSKWIPLSSFLDSWKKITRFNRKLDMCYCTHHFRILLPSMVYYWKSKGVWEEYQL